jgi:hypothetical protein
MRIRDQWIWDLAVVAIVIGQSHCQRDVRSLAAAVVRHEIIDNDLGIGRPDRRAECRDHLVYLGLPTLAVEKRRVDAQIIERVTLVAMTFNDVPAGASLERDVF